MEERRDPVVAAVAQQEIVRLFVPVPDKAQADRVPHGVENDYGQKVVEAVQKLDCVPEVCLEVPVHKVSDQEHHAHEGIHDYPCQMAIR